MAFDGDKTRLWDRTTLNDGDYFESEFERVYANLNDLNTRYDQLLTDHTALQADFDKNKRIVGEKFWLDDYIQPSGSFPAFCLSQPDTIMAGGYWHDLVPYLYNKKLRYEPMGLDRSSFQVKSWAVDNAAGTATLTFRGYVQVPNYTETNGSKIIAMNDTSGLEVGMYLASHRSGGEVRTEEYFIESISANVSVTLNIPFGLTSGSGSGLDFGYPEDKVLEALGEDQEVSNSYSDWRTITLPNGVGGTIVAGTYNITNIDADNRTVTFTFSGPDGAGEVSSDPLAVVEFYPHRIAGVSDSVRHLCVGGRTFTTANDNDREIFGGLRRRDRYQRFKVETQGARMYLEGGSGSATVLHGPSSSLGVIDYPDIQDAILSDNSGELRTGRSTDPKMEGNYAYIWGGRYNGG